MRPTPEAIAAPKGTLEEGTSPSSWAPEGAPAEFLKTNAQPTLTDLTQDFAPLYQGAIIEKLGIDPVPGIYSELDLLAEARPKLFALKQSIQGGNGPIDAVLHLIPKQHWSKVAQQLSLLTYIQRGRKFYCQVILQQIPILDRAMGATRSLSQLPLIDCYFVGLDTNIACFHWQPPQNPLGLVTLLRDDPLPETVRLAKAIFEEHQNPYQAIELEER